MLRFLFLLLGNSPDVPASHRKHGMENLYLVLRHECPGDSFRLLFSTRGRWILPVFRPYRSVKEKR